MWTCQVVKNGETYLGRHLVANDYYDEGNKVVGQWVGNAARILGIEGQEIHSGDAHFESLRTNVHPTLGGPLTQRTGETRRAFFDFQISAPKSVSIMAVTFGDDRLRLAHEEAVAASFKCLEEFSARRERTGETVNGKNSIFTGNVVSARFTHDSSRNLDAQLHTHVVTANATYDEKTGKWYALENQEMFRAVGYAGRVYQAELALRVKALGYKITEDRENGKIRGFEIVGVTEEDRAKQSTRRAEIEAAIEKFKSEKGRPPSAAETHVMAVETRSKKMAEISTEEVRGKQLSKYDSQAQARLKALIQNAKTKSREGLPSESRKQLAHEAAEFAVKHRFERDGVLSMRELATTALEENLGLVTVDDVKEALIANEEIVRLDHVDGTPLWSALLTTKDYLNSEYDSIKIVNDGKGKFDPLAKEASLSSKLGIDQKNAVIKILESKDSVVSLRGPAGAGKTFTLKEIDRIIELSGKRTLFVAPTHAAKSVLQKDGFKETETVSGFMVKLRKDEVDLKNRILIVDEAGMLSSKQGFSLLNESLKKGARIILVGDEQQLLSIEAGDFLGNLKKHSEIEVAELTEIRRQNVADYRESMVKMGQGKISKGVEILDKTGRVIEGKSNYIGNAVNAFIRKTDLGESTLIVAPTWSEIEKINSLVRDSMTNRGNLKGDAHTIKIINISDFTTAQRCKSKSYQKGMMVSSWKSLGGLKSGSWQRIERLEDGNLILESGISINPTRDGRFLIVGEEKKIAIQEGERILIQGNDKVAGLKNGEVVTVSKIDKNSEITIENKEGESINIPQSFRTFSHGYAVTVEKSQGSTVDSVIVAGSKMSGRRIYVSTSRGRKDVEVHVPDKSEFLAKAKKGIESRKTAMDTLKRSAKGISIDRKKTLRPWEKWQSWVNKIQNFIQSRLRINLRRSQELGLSR